MCICARSGSRRFNFIHQNLGVDKGVSSQREYTNRLNTIHLDAWGQPDDFSELKGFGRLYEIPLSFFE
jgi:hypothetical protein